MSKSNDVVKKNLDEAYAEARTKLPFTERISNPKMLCVFCSKLGTEVIYYYLDPGGNTRLKHFCCETCLNMFLILRL